MAYIPNKRIKYMLNRLILIQTKKEDLTISLQKFSNKMRFSRCKIMGIQLVYLKSWVYLLKTSEDGWKWAQRGRMEAAGRHSTQSWRNS